VLAQILNEVGHGFVDVFKPGIVEPALLGIGLRQPDERASHIVKNNNANQPGDA